MSSPTIAPETVVAQYIPSGVKLKNITGEDDYDEELELLVDFGYIYTSSRQTDHFEETLQCYEEAPPLIDYKPESFADTESMIDEKEARSDNIEEGEVVEGVAPQAENSQLGESLEMKVVKCGTDQNEEEEKDRPQESIKPVEAFQPVEAPQPIKTPQPTEASQLGGTPQPVDTPQPHNLTRSGNTRTEEGDDDSSNKELTYAHHTVDELKSQTAPISKKKQTAHKKKMETETLSEEAQIEAIINALKAMNEERQTLEDLPAAPASETATVEPMDVTSQMEMSPMPMGGLLTEQQLRDNQILLDLHSELEQSHFSLSDMHANDPPVDPMEEFQDIASVSDGQSIHSFHDTDFNNPSQSKESDIMLRTLEHEGTIAPMDIEHQWTINKETTETNSQSKNKLTFGNKRGRPKLKAATNNLNPDTKTQTKTNTVSKKLGKKNQNTESKKGEQKRQKKQNPELSKLEEDKRETIVKDEEQQTQEHPTVLEESRVITLDEIRGIEPPIKGPLPILLNPVPNNVPGIFTSTVDVIPNATKLIDDKSENFKLPSTLSKKSELQKSTTLTSSSINVFAGPRYYPEEYQIKSNVDAQGVPIRQRPSINHFFQAALEDGSFFARYDEYNPEDPVNFRHAYKLKQYQKGASGFNVLAESQNSRESSPIYQQIFSHVTPTHPSPARKVSIQKLAVQNSPVHDSPAHVSPEHDSQEHKLQSNKSSLHSKPASLLNPTPPQEVLRQPRTQPPLESATALTEHTQTRSTPLDLALVHTESADVSAVRKPPARKWHKPVSPPHFEQEDIFQESSAFDDELAEDFSDNIESPVLASDKVDSMSDDGVTIEPQAPRKRTPSTSSAGNLKNALPLQKKARFQNTAFKEDALSDSSVSYPDSESFSDDDDEYQGGEEEEEEDEDPVLRRGDELEVDIPEKKNYGVKHKDKVEAENTIDYQFISYHPEPSSEEQSEVDDRADSMDEEEDQLDEDDDDDPPYNTKTTYTLPSNKEDDDDAVWAIPEPPVNEVISTSSDNNRTTRKINNVTTHFMLWNTRKNAFRDCVICFSRSKTEDEVIECDNIFCDVKVHRGCYWTNVGKGPWKCDRCKYYDKGQIKFTMGTCCALCPDTNGLFCRINMAQFSIPWVHYGCAFVFLEKSQSFVYRPVSLDFQFHLNAIPLKNFENKCSYCTDSLYAEYGAKMECRSCTNWFHVSCIQKLTFRSLKGILDSPLCLEHGTCDSKQVKSYYAWRDRKDAFLRRDFFKKPEDLFRTEVWKTFAEGLKGPIQMGAPILSERYVRFLEGIRLVTYTSQNSDYYRSWVEYILSVIARNITKSNVNFILSSPKGVSQIIDNTFDKEAFLGKQTKQAFKPLTVKRKKVKSTGTKPKKRRTITKPVQVIDTKSKVPKPEEFVVQPSDDLVCSICCQHEFPKERWETLLLPDNYLELLEETQHLRKPGFTGKSTHWDPRVFIKCAQCSTIVHCGCPFTPIKDYPSRYRRFVCVQCDTSNDQQLLTAVDSKRVKKSVNYKV